jgi:hypothetical protein
MNLAKTAARDAWLLIGTLAATHLPVCGTQADVLLATVVSCSSGRSRIRVAVVIVGHRQGRTRCRPLSRRENEHGGGDPVGRAPVRHQEGEVAGDSRLRVRPRWDGRSNGTSANPVPTSERHQIATSKSRVRDSGVWVESGRAGRGPPSSSEAGVSGAPHRGRRGVLPS